MTKITATINVAAGLHARPANIFIKTASQFKSAIRVSKEGKEVDGKRLLAIMTLGVRQGESITITADGEDEKDAILALEEMIAKDFE
ncbi:MAG TPA: HPr family phosphocarrier protein [Epulopiscium sp.]|nr:HPr family phosphocarrier protein [Candidatus Epulonipiscium sp.]